MVSVLMRLPGQGIWLIALLGCLLMVACTHWGVGITPDSSTYVGMARSILEGQGLSVWTPDGYRPISQYPPFYSILLAGGGWMGVEPLVAARWLNLILFGLNIWLVGFLVQRITGLEAPALLASGFYATSEISLEMHSVAWTEPLFIFLGLSGLYALSIFIEGRNRALLLLASLLIALAFLTRYVGVVLVGSGVLAILRHLRGTISKLVASFIFLTVAVIPMVIWLARNSRATGTSTNREFAYYPFELSASDTIQLLIPIVFVVGMVWFRSRPSSKPQLARGAGGTFLVTLLTFIALYVLLLVASFTFADPTITVTNRLFAPIYTAMAIVTIGHWPAIRSALNSRTTLRRGTVWFGVILVAIHLFNATVLIVDRIRNGFAYGGGAWVESGMMEELRRLPPETVVYTNAGYAVSTLLGYPTTGIPAEDRDLPGMVESLQATGGVVAFFDCEAYLVRYSGDELAGVPGLHQVFQSEEGRIFRANSPGTP